MSMTSPGLASNGWLSSKWVASSIFAVITRIVRFLGRRPVNSNARLPSILLQQICEFKFCTVKQPAVAELQGRNHEQRHEGERHIRRSQLRSPGFHKLVEFAIGSADFLARASRHQTGD